MKIFWKILLLTQKTLTNPIMQTRKLIQLVRFWLDFRVAVKLQMAHPVLFAYLDSEFKPRISVEKYQWKFSKSCEAILNIFRTTIIFSRQGALVHIGIFKLSIFETLIEMNWRFLFMKFLNFFLKLLWNKKITSSLKLNR